MPAAHGSHSIGYWLWLLATGGWPLAGRLCASESQTAPKPAASPPEASSPKNQRLGPLGSVALNVPVNGTPIGPTGMYTTVWFGEFTISLLRFDRLMLDVHPA